MHFMYDTVNALLPRLVDVAMFFLEQDPGGRPVYPAFVRGNFVLARIVGLQWVRALGIVQVMNAANQNAF